VRSEGTPPGDRRRGPGGQPGGGVPVTAGAPTKTYRFTVSGTEVSATSTTGRFVGAASGSTLGTWYAEVVHDPLSGGVGAQVAIQSGGSFAMALAQAEPAHVVSGQFSGGTITTINPGARCTDQAYAVNGDLKNVSVTGTGHFSATLTHHRRSVLGRCWALCSDGQRHRHAGLIAGSKAAAEVTIAWIQRSNPGLPFFRECPWPRAVTTGR